MGKLFLISIEVEDIKQCALCKSNMYKEHTGVVLMSYPPKHLVIWKCVDCDNEESSIEVRSKLISREEYHKLWKEKNFND